MSKLKVIHIIVGLNVGGAETMLYKLLKYSDRTKFEFEVISLMDKGFYGSEIEKLGIKVHALGMRRGSISFSALRTAKSLVKKADIIQTWMYHADLLGYLIKDRSRKQKLIWGIRRSDLNRKNNKIFLLTIAKINSLISKNVDLIISCSKKATQVHTEFGYDSSKMITIPNGFELETFYKREGSKIEIESELQLDRGNPIMIHIGRWNVQKDYPNLVKAIKLVKNERPDINFLLCGTGIERTNKDLVNLLEDNGVVRNVHLLGRRDDIPRVLSASDGLISSSLGEGFSNVIGEAMACEVPCIVTDVGDSAYIVDKHGLVVTSQNSAKLAQAILEFTGMDDIEKREMGIKARNRIMSKFEIKKITSEFEKQYII